MPQAANPVLVLPPWLAESLSRSSIRDPLGEGAFDEQEARRYAKALAHGHYENFHVGSILFPKDVRDDAFAVYAFCRWADDLGDETGSTESSTRLLNWWREKLHALYEGATPDHIVYTALKPTIQRFDLPQELFDDLIDAFLQDQTKVRYETWDELLEYCVRSANPVGRLVLRLLGYDDPEFDRLSDHTCTALQLANFWQDVENDLVRGRIYLPREDMDRFEVNEEDLALPRAGENTRRLLAHEVDRTEEMFRKGLPLADKVRGRARFDIQLFSQGGLAILRAVRAQNYDVLARRPTVGKLRKMGLLARALLKGLPGRRGGRS